MHSAQQQTPRGVLPSHVTDNSIVLCKSAPSIENTYEIRLTIFFAVKAKKTFELRVPPSAVVAPDLAALIAQQGGRISQVSVGQLLRILAFALVASGIETRHFLFRPDTSSIQTGVVW